MYQEALSPGDQTVIAALDGGCFESSHLFAQDFRNARRIFGTYRACAEGKIRTPSEPVSQSEPDRTVGRHLHIDILPLYRIRVWPEAHAHFLQWTRNRRITLASLSHPNVS